MWHTRRPSQYCALHSWGCRVVAHYQMVLHFASCFPYTPIQIHRHHPTHVFGDINATPDIRHFIQQSLHRDAPGWKADKLTWKPDDDDLAALAGNLFAWAGVAVKMIRSSDGVSSQILSPPPRHRTVFNVPPQRPGSSRPILARIVPADGLKPGKT